MPRKNIIFVEHTPEVTTISLLDTQILEQKEIQDLEEAIMEVVQQSKRQLLVLNFGNIRFLSSSMLGLLVKLQKRLTEEKRRLELHNIKPDIMKVFKITKLDKLFVIKSKGG